MQIRHLRIERFRGIRLLDWKVDGDLICLIGPCDSTKSTIIEAIELALSPRWDYPFDDSDFFGCNTGFPIEITATVGQLPDALLGDNKFGLSIRGWNQDGGLRDEPGENDEPVLSVRLVVDSSLEPEWTVVNDRSPRGRSITSRDRQLLGVLRLSPHVDRQLTWTDGTVLLKLTGELGSLRAILAEAGRAARAAIKQDTLPSLAEAAVRAEKLARAHGVAPRTGYQPGLDTQRVSIGRGGIALHDGNIPLRRAGLGTRRLLTFALQREVAKAGGITLVDEVEHGLEPHRIRFLVRALRPEDRLGQVIMTTHSPVVAEELGAVSLKIVRSNDGETKITDVVPSLQKLVRRASEALLGRKVIVCEGKTELGLCRAFDRFWSRLHGKEGFAYLGVVPVEGGGSDAPQRAVELRALDYDVCFLGDSNCNLVPSCEAMQAEGIRVVTWADDMFTELRIVQDLPWQGVLELVEMAIAQKSEDSVRGAIAGYLERNEALTEGRPCGWTDSLTLRRAIGCGANTGKWFKLIDTGEWLGTLVCKHIDRMEITDIVHKMNELREWVDGSD